MTVSAVLPSANLPGDQQPRPAPRRGGDDRRRGTIGGGRTHLRHRGISLRDFRRVGPLANDDVMGADRCFDDSVKFGLAPTADLGNEYFIATDNAEGGTGFAGKLA